LRSLAEQGDFNNDSIFKHHLIQKKREIPRLRLRFEAALLHQVSAAPFEEKGDYLELTL